MNTSVALIHANWLKNAIRTVDADVVVRTVDADAVLQAVAYFQNLQIPLDLVNVKHCHGVGLLIIQGKLVKL